MGDGTKLDLDLVFGTSDLNAVKGIFSFIYLTLDGKDGENTKVVEKDALDRVLQLRDELEADATTNVRIEVLTVRSLNDEFQRAIFEDLYLLPVVLGVMFIFTCFVFYRKNPVQSRSLLGIGSVTTIFLSIT